MNSQKFLLTSASNHSGLSNKLHAWAHAYFLAEQNNMLLVQDWQGDVEYLDLPKTISIKTLPEDTTWVDLNTNNFKNFSGRLPDNINIKLTCGYNYSRNNEDKIHYKTLFEQVQLDHPSYEKVLQVTQDPNLIGLHIRRSDFYPPTQTDEDFTGINRQVHEKWYVSVMNDLQKQNSNIKFYLATENTNNFLHLYSKFNIIDRTIFNLNESNRPEHNYKLFLPDFFDLFVLKHANCFVETPRSSYSHLASLMRNKPTITSNTYKGYYFHTRNY
jgi:hypothetical protein